MELNHATPSISSPLRRTSIVLMVMVLGIHATLLAAIYQRTVGSRSLGRDVGSLRSNVERLESTLANHEAEVAVELRQAEQALQALRLNPPQLRDPDEVIDQAFNLSPLDSIQLNSVIRVGLSEQETSYGPVEAHTFRFAGEGSLEDCLAFIGRLESSGEPTLASENVVIEPETRGCSFDVLLMSPPSSQ